MLRLSRQECARIHELTKEYTHHDQVLRMKDYTQHGNVNTYDHCRNVARVSYLLNKRLHVGCDEKVLLTGAMLHDFYLYDWHEKDDGSHRLHGFHHAEKARANAVRHFQIGDREQAVIASHMWPLTIRKIPSSREAVLVCVADKYCSSVETLFRRGKNGGKPIGLTQGRRHRND